MATDPERVVEQTDAERIADLEQQLKETQDQLNEEKIKTANKEKESNRIAGQLSWLTRKYNELVALAFDKMFDLSVEIKTKHLRYILIERTQEEAALEQAEANKENN